MNWHAPPTNLLSHFSFNRSENSSIVMRNSTLLVLAACLLQVFAFASEEHGCTLQQWHADNQFTLNGGAITQMFTPCQTGVVEYIAIGAQSASDDSFGARLKLYEMDNGVMTLVHQQQGIVPMLETAFHTVFSLTRDIAVSEEREYFIEVDIPQGRAMQFQYSGDDVYDEGELTVNHARFRGDLAFEVGVNPRSVYDVAEVATSPVLRTWSTGNSAPEHACSVSQPKYNGVEMLQAGSWSQTFSSCYTGSLESIWFQGEIVHAETGVPVYLFERETGDFVGASELTEHPDRQRTLTANFGDLELKAGREYEFFIDCTEDQHLNLHVIRNRGFFIGEFRHMHQVLDANLSFMAFLKDDETSGIDAAWPYDAGSEYTEASLSVSQLPDASGIQVTLDQDISGPVTIGLFNLLGQQVEQRTLNNPVAGTQIFFSTEGDHDQEYYTVRVLNDQELVIDTVYRR